MAKKISILPVARVMIAQYDDVATAKRVVYQLVKAGISRHNIAIHRADQHGVETERFNFDIPEKARHRDIKDETPHGVLVVAWVLVYNQEAAEEIMNAHNPKGFKDRASDWEPGIHTKFEWILGRRKK